MTWLMLWIALFIGVGVLGVYCRLHEDRHR